VNKLVPKSLPAHVGGLLAYLNQPTEKANEDLVLAYFRKAFGGAFTRQKDAKQSDGYVSGLFVLELKGNTNNWLSGLFQGLAYKNRDLHFSQIVVAARNFLAVWRVEDLPLKIREEVMGEARAPNSVGRLYAKKYAHKKNELLKLAVWNGSDLLAPLFLSQPDLVASKLSQFEKTLKEGRKIRQKITCRNFPTLLKEMKQYFDPKQPIKTVRAFYSEPRRQPRRLFGLSHAAIGVDDERHVDEARPGGDVGKVRDPQQVRARRPELAVDAVQRAWHGLVADRRPHASSANDALQPSPFQGEGARRRCGNRLDAKTSRFGSHCAGTDMGRQPPPRQPCQVRLSRIICRTTRSNGTTRKPPGISPATV
jgi:hypothetical protein